MPLTRRMLETELARERGVLRRLETDLRTRPDDGLRERCRAVRSRIAALENELELAREARPC